MVSWRKTLSCIRHLRRSTSDAANKSPKDLHSKIEEPVGQQEHPSHGVSAFLHHLPPELRLLIYRYVFQDHVFHLVRLPRNPHFPPVTCSSGATTVPRRDIAGDHPLFPRPLEGPKVPSTFVNIPLVERHGERRTKWALLLTCHQIHNEASHIFYGASVLRFDDPHILLDLATNYLTKRHLRALRRLEVVWRCVVPYPADVHTDNPRPWSEHWQPAWKQMWYLVAWEMKISSLKIWFSCTGAPLVGTANDWWVQPLLKIRGLSECGIFVEPYDVGSFRGFVAPEFRESVRKRLSQNGNRMIG